MQRPYQSDMRPNTQNPELFEGGHTVSTHPQTILGFEYWVLSCTSRY